MGNNICNLYTKDKKLDERQFASVFECIRKSDDQVFAVKIFNKQNTTNVVLEYIKIEKKILQQVDYPNIMKFVDFVEDKANYYIVKELAPGGTLEDYIKSRNGEPMSQDEILDIFLPLVQAVEYLNQNGLVHRVINPRNLFFRKYGQDVMLGDIGCTKYKIKKCEEMRESFKEMRKSSVGSVHSMSTQPSKFQSQNYMVPEFLNNEYCDYSCDVWQLGVLLYELIENKQPTIDEILEKKKFQAIRLPELNPLLQSCLQYDTTKRPTASKLLQTEILIDFIQNKEIKTFRKVVESVEKMQKYFESGNWKIGRNIQTVDKYEGEIQKGKYHGLGRLKFYGGNISQGEFKDGKLNGLGIQTRPDGSRYEGEFQDNKRNGQGVWTDPDQVRYQGEFKDDKFHGDGAWTDKNGISYEGEFKYGHLNGKGVWSDQNGSKYQGDFKDGKFHGSGVWTDRDGIRYEGQFNYDKFHGQGVWTDGDGVRYEGQFMDNKRNGKGVWTDPDGVRYEGEFEDDKVYGQGILTEPDGQKYKGEYKDGKFNRQSVWTE